MQMSARLGRFCYRKIGWLGSVLLGLGCAPHTAPFHPHVADSIHLPKARPIFIAADRQKYRQDYLSARDSFLQVWTQGPLSTLQDSFYCLNQLVYVNLCTYREAEAERWQTHIERLGGVNRMNTANQGDYWYNKGRLGYHLLKDTTGVISSLDRALSLYERVYRGPHLRVYQTLNLLASARYDLDRLSDSCFVAAHRARAMLTDTVLAPYSKENLLALSFQQLTNRDFISGVAACKKACTLALNAPYLDTVVYVKALAQMAQMLKKQGDVAAKELQQKRYSEADFLLDRALTLARRMPRQLTQLPYLSAAYLYIARRDSVALQALLQEADSVVATYGIRNIHPDGARAYGYMARLSEAKRTPQEKSVYAQKAVAIYDRILRENATNPLCHRNLLQEADMQLILGFEYLQQYARAVTTLQAAIVRFTPYEQRNLTLREVLYNDTLRNGRNKFIYYAMLGGNLLNQYKTERRSNFHLLTLAFDYLNATDSLYFSGVYSHDPDAVMRYYSELEKDRHLFSNGLYAAHALYHVYQPSGRDLHVYVNAAIRFLEHKKTFLLHRDMFLGESANFPRAQADSLYQLVQHITTLKWQQKRQQKEAGKWALDSLIQALSDRYEHIKKHYPVYYAQKVNPPIATLAQIQDSLAENQGVVEYGLAKDYVPSSPVIGKGGQRAAMLQTRPTTYLYTLYIGKAKGEVVFQRQPVVEGTFTESCQILSHGSPTSGKGQRPAKENSKQAFGQASAHLYKQLIQPFENWLRPDIRLLVIGDDLLYQLPFEALRPQEAAPFLVQRAYVSYAPSWRIFLHNRQPLRLQGRAAMAIGYGDLSMPASSLVLDFLSQQFRARIQIYTKQRCSKQVLLHNDTPLWLCHLGVHGSSNTADRYENYLNFGQDTLFSAELGWLKSPPQLLVLCSCHTASGQIVAGEGAYTLSRAFLQSGVHHIVSALWQLDDAASVRLLVPFYEGLAAGKDITTALTDAKRAYLDDTLYRDNTEWSALIHLI